MIRQTEQIRCRAERTRQSILRQIDLMIDNLKMLHRDLSSGGYKRSGFIGSSGSTLDAEIGFHAGLSEAFETIEAFRKLAELTPRQVAVFDSIEDRNQFVDWFREKMDDAGFAFSDHDKRRWDTAMEGW